MRRWLFAQADESEATRKAPLARRLLAGASIVSAVLSAVLGASACLVLQDNEVVGVENYSELRRISPELFSQAFSEGGDPTCPGAPAMHFQVELFDRDVRQPLWRRLTVNGVGIDLGGPTPIQPEPVPNEKRAISDLCVPLSKLERPCNLVELTVTSDYEKARSLTTDSPLDPDFRRLQWFVAGSVGSGFADARPSDCVRLLSAGGVE